MKAMDLLVGFGSVKDSYVISAEEFRQGKQKAQVKCLSTRKMWLIAAVIALMLLLVGCAVVYVLHLQDMKIGEEVITQEAWTGPSGEYMPSTEWVNTQLSLQGYNGSPEQQALREWLDFKEQYDPDGTLMKENNMNESGVPEQYYITYDCYTFEMMDKLNEILDKYHLNALGTWIYFDRWETPLFYNALQLDSLCRTDADVQRMAGYFSPEGSFHAVFGQTLAGDQEERLITYTYAKNSYFYPYYSAMLNIELWEEWHYTTADGSDVLLATYENALVIICDCGDGFIHISTENNMLNPPFDNTAEPMTRQNAEKIADSFNYSISPQPCDPEEVEAMRVNHPEPERQSHFMIGFRIPPEADFWLPPEEVADSFAHYISYVLENRNAAGNRDVDQLDYCITDLNGDGKQEVLLRYRDTGKYREILQMVEDPDSRQQVVSVRFINGYLYEGPVFESVIDDTKVDGFLYYEYRDFDWNSIACLRYDPETKTWTQSSSKGNTFDAIWEPISESEANAIRRSYKPLSLDMKPLSQFNMNG